MTNLTIFAAMLALEGNIMYSEGKIYVVIAVVALVLLGLFAYLTYIDRKISKIEKKIKSGNGR